MANSAFSILSLTDNAAARTRELLAQAGNADKLLKIGIKNGGCAGMSYTLDLIDELGPLDEIIEDKGVRLAVAPQDVMFLLGTQVDFVTDRLGSSFTFRNPNQTGSCGCGESVSITPAQPETARS
ncbi:HesB/IscA family protein [Beijerinckia indica]|uniref:Iron-sulfur cluster assembly accessory protein n=1 Tax=Beijerinckia indica subsp. indica (strain ATCC 9039 / DSM 1715 / NCIMB 8712) TaxID=395963 RepID=B2IBP0_BEII9|nr:iron-sulfur cluster assembly accessory protein [Beijerinckia indica]ACB93762.1 iron-sulfur cluster assembly accessory protein [Beijerinckia indica subsp. indica ATCC 9039]